jgi:hypothetical protein
MGLRTDGSLEQSLGSGYRVNSSLFSCEFNSLDETIGRGPPEGRRIPSYIRTRQEAPPCTV